MEEQLHTWEKNNVTILQINKIYFDTRIIVISLLPSDKL